MRSEEENPSRPACATVLQLPLPLQIATAEGAKNGLLVSGD